MKLTAIILLAACLQLSAKGLSQAITLAVKDAPLQQVFVAIEKQTDYRFFYNLDILQKTNRVTVNAQSLSLKTILDIIFKNQPVTYTVHGNVITVGSKKNEAGEESASENKQVIDVRGRVVNENGEPVAASVIVKGTKLGVNTNENGEFHITGVDENSVLIISGVGIESTEIKVNGRTQLSIIAKIVIKPLDEVQMIAYGTTTRRLNTGNVSSMKAREIEMQPVNNPLLALEGRVTGLQITQNTGVPGGGIKIRLQGQNSLTRGNDPLYVIDGVPYISQLPPNVSGTFQILGDNGNTNNFAPGGGGNPLSFINPADIERIDVLKDADATAIYGSRAANGAILITTKKGKSGKTKFDLNVQTGWGKVTRMMPLLNTEQYLAMRREAFANDSLKVPSITATPSNTDFDINGAWDTTRYTDWQKELIGGTALYTDAQASVSGGSINTQFLVGGGYHRETTVFPGDLADQKSSVHLNINHVSNNQRFKIQIDGKYLVDNNRLILSDLTSAALQLVPDAPALYNVDGSLNWAPVTTGVSTVSTWVNPLSNLLSPYSYRTNNLISNALVSYQITKGLELKSNFGYTNLQSNELYRNPLLSYAPERRPNLNRTATFANSSVVTWIAEPQLNYKRNIGGGAMDVLVGTTLSQNNSNQMRLLGTGFSSDYVMEDIKAAPTVSVQQTLVSTYRYNALFGRLNYSWGNRYILNLTARRDGSSRFGAQNLFHNFGSIGGAWVFSNESFIKKQLPLLSFGKLRASFGTTGNDQIGDYQFMSLYNSQSVPVAYQGATGLTPAGLPNPYLQWEETRKLQFGMEMGFLHDRIFITANYYINRSSNLLSNYALPIFTGNATLPINLPALVRNTGLEINVTTKNIDIKDFSWTSDLNFTIPRNELVRFPNLDNTTYANIYVIGQPISIRKVYHLVDVDPATGLFQYEDRSGHIVNTPNSITDNYKLVNTDPKIYGGLENSLHYKGFDLDFLFQFFKQMAPNYYFGRTPGRFSSSSSSTPVFNQPVYVLNRWQAPQDITNMQKFSSKYPITTYLTSIASDAAFSDASYIRLKNISLSWQLPVDWRQKASLQNARIYIQGQNLITITHYKGMDPENTSLTFLPPLKVLTVGLQVGL